MSFSHFWCAPITVQMEEFLDATQDRVLPVDWEESAKVHGLDWTLVMTDDERMRDCIYSDALAAKAEDNEGESAWTYCVHNDPLKRPVWSRTGTGGQKPFGAMNCLTSHGGRMHTEHRYPLLTMEWLLTHGFAEAPLVKTP